MNIKNLGLIDYMEAWDLQKKLVEERIAGKTVNTLLLCEHYPVITKGRKASSGNILADPERLIQDGVQVYNIERGGDVTFHGPGQLVAYPIFDLKTFQPDIHWFLRKLEDAVIEFLKEFEVRGCRNFGKTGVWVGDYKTLPPVDRKVYPLDKLASIGVAIRRWVTFHGVAVNINTDLKFFKLINPCGMTSDRMTSLAAITGKTWDMEDAADKLSASFERVFVEGAEDDDHAVSAVAQAQNIS